MNKPFSLRALQRVLSASCLVCCVAFTSSTRCFAARLAVSVSASVAPSYVPLSLQKSADALTRFSALTNVPIAEINAQNALSPFAKPLLSPDAAQMQSVASSLKLSLTPVETFAQLSERGGAALVRLQTPDEWVVLGGVGSKRSVLQSENGAQIGENTVLSSRFVSALALTSSVAEKPRVFIDEPVQTVHVTTVGEAARARVLVQNRGDAPLQLQVLRTSCSCTSDDNSVRVVAPNGSGELSFKIEAREEGTRTVSVLIGTNDILAPRLPLAFQIVTPHIPTPPTVFLSGNKGEIVRGTFDLTLPTSATIERISSTRSEVSARLLPSENATTARIEIALAADTPVGQFSDALQIVLKNSEVERIVVPIDGYINNDIAVTPRLVSLGEVGLNEIVRRTVLLQAPADQPFAVLKIQSEKPFVTAKTDFGVVGISHVIEIEATPKINSSLQNRLTLTLSGDRELDVDIVGNIVSQNAKPALQVGQMAPDFVVLDANGKLQELSERRNKKNVLLTFFPRCFTGGCTAQNLSLRDEYANFVRLNTEILAVSVDAADGEDGQRAFAAKYELPYPLIPDTSRALSIMYGAAQSANDATSLRQSVLIDKNGVVRWIDRNIQTATHGADVLRAMRELGMD